MTSFFACKKRSLSFKGFLFNPFARCTKSIRLCAIETVKPDVDDVFSQSWTFLMKKNMCKFRLDWIISDERLHLESSPDVDVYRITKKFNAFIHAANHGIFSRLTSVNKWPEADKSGDVEVKTNAATSGSSWWADDFQTNHWFVPPPPRPPFLEGMFKSR